MLVLLGAVGFVLLIACSNIAGLMVARTSGRAREIAVRAALGAGRRQLIHQVISESLLLASAGAAAGLAVGYGGMRLLLAFAPENSVIGLNTRLDVRVLLFTAAVAIVSGILFGLAPAWQISQIHPYEILKTSGRSASAGHGRQRLRAALVVGEAALAVVLLAGAGLFLRSLTRLQDVKPGFEPHGVMTATLSLPRTQYAAPEKQIVFSRSVLERLSGVRGVTAAATGIPLPFSGNDASSSFNIEGRASAPGDPGPHGDVRYVTPAYFEAMGIPLKSGRYFASRDTRDTAPVVVIDENLARQYWPGENPLDKHMRRGGRAPWSSIVGVVGHVNHSDLSGDTGKGVYYWALDLLGKVLGRNAYLSTLEGQLAMNFPGDLHLAAGLDLHCRPGKLDQVTRHYFDFDRRLRKPSPACRRSRPAPRRSCRRLDHGIERHGPLEAGNSEASWWMFQAPIESATSLRPGTTRT